MKWHWFLFRKQYIFFVRSNLIFALLLKNVRGKSNYLVLHNNYFCEVTADIRGNLAIHTRSLNSVVRLNSILKLW